MNLFQCLYPACSFIGSNAATGQHLYGTHVRHGDWRAPFFIREVGVLSPEAAIRENMLILSLTHGTLQCFKLPNGQTFLAIVWALPEAEAQYHALQEQLHAFGPPEHAPSC